jgi:hypothetical protein
VASAIAICVITDNTRGPSSRSESITGSASAADDDTISTAYTVACPVPNTFASTTPSTAATAPMATTLSWGCVIQRQPAYVGLARTH